MLLHCFTGLDLTSASHTIVGSFELDLDKRNSTWDKLFFYAIVEASGDSRGTCSFAASPVPVALLAVPPLPLLAGDEQRSRAGTSE